MQLITTSTVTDLTDIIENGQPGKSVFRTSDGNYHFVFFWTDATTLKYSISSDNGKTWSTPTTVISGATNRRKNGFIDSSDNIYLIFKSISGTDRKLHMIKFTYNGSGEWTQGTTKDVYTDNKCMRWDITKDSSDKLWLVIREYNFATSTWEDLKVTSSTDDGDNWSSLTTLKVSGGDGWIGYRPTIGLRNDNPVVIYGNTGDYFAVRE